VDVVGVAILKKLCQVFAAAVVKIADLILAAVTADQFRNLHQAALLELHGLRAGILDQRQLRLLARNPFGILLGALGNGRSFLLGIRRHRFDQPLKRIQVGFAALAGLPALMARDEPARLHGLDMLLDGSGLHPNGLGNGGH
jgi:hypothetical protein